MSALAVFAMAIAASAAVAPGSSDARPSQEGPAEGADTDDALASIDVEVADGDAAAITGALDEIFANVGLQLQQLGAAEAAIGQKLDELADIDLAIEETQAEIDSLTGTSDAVVVTSFMNPPSEAAIDTLTADSMSDATVKQALLQMRADAEAEKLADLQDARRRLQEQQDVQRQARADAEVAKSEAESALADLETAVGQQTQFILDVRDWLANPDGALKLAAQGPDEAARVQSMTDELTTRISELEQAEQTREAAEAAAEARRRVLEGGFSCPVDAPSRFSDTWGDPRPGGRVHKGTDMMAPTGTPLVAPVSGRLVHKTDSIGGMSFFVYGDDGHKYFGTHLSAYENQGAGWVEAGTPVGRIGATGNASTPHLHFAYYPNDGEPVNPYKRLAEVCPRA